MARKATYQVTVIGIDIGQTNFHLIGPNVAFGSPSDYRHRHTGSLHLEVKRT